MRTAEGFEGRRIQKTGGSTFIVSLPKPWVIHRGLTAGDVLLFTPGSDGSLTLHAQAGKPSEQSRRVVVVSNEMDAEHLFRLLIAEYIAGAPLVEVRTSSRMSARTRDVVRGFAQRMIGPEILEETADAVVLQDVVGANPLPIPSILRRTHQMVRAMQTDAMAAVLARDTAIAKDVIERDWEVDRLHWFVEKQVTSALRDARILASLGLTLPDCATYLLASRVLERIADHAVRIAETVEMFGKERPPEGLLETLQSLARSASEGLDQALDSLEDGNVERANAVIDAGDRIQRDREKILSELSSKRGRMAVALAYILESVERSAFYASDLAEIAINHAIQARNGSGKPSVGTPAKGSPVPPARRAV